MKEVFDKIKEGLIDILVPRRCVWCKKEGKYICDNCGLFLSETPSIFGVGGLEELVSIWEYEGLIKKLIYKIKYEGMFDAIDELVERAFGIREPYIPEDTTITFVPMFKKKEKQRGFNQAELIAKKVGEKTGREVLPLLEKIKDTSYQTELNKEERMANVRDSFKFIETIENRSRRENVLWVDDVWTSGATMQECCRILKRSGVKKVWGFTLVRTV